jgi:peptide/nickel transport system permease protein
MNSFINFAKRFCRNRSAVVGLLLLVCVALMAISAPLLFPEDPWDMVAAPFLWPGQDPKFLLGSDIMGRDLASGLFHGARISLLVGFTATLAAVLLGTAVGAIAGFYGGRIDSALMALTELFQTIPQFIFAIVVVAILAPTVTTVTFALAIVSWPAIARLVRAEFMTLRERDFVLAGISVGMSNFRIITTQILPNALGPIIVTGSLMIATTILTEAGLAFLGLGDPNVMSWGTIIGAGRDALRSAWYITAIPGLAIMFTVLGLNLVGEGLNDALNPRLKNR